MVTLTTANNALKNVYLDVVANQLDANIDCVLGKIKKTTSDVYGKEIIVPTYINGKNYILKSELANIYAKLEITDKAIRCSQNSAGAFVNLLNGEMEQLVKNASRQITNSFYGEDKPHEYMTEQEKNNYVPLVMNGLQYLFNDKEEFLYGIKREKIRPITKTIKQLNDANIQSIIDDYNEDVDFIVCNQNTKRAYMEYLNESYRNIELMEFVGGFKCIAFNGIIPIATNRNIPDNEIYIINTDDFKLHQLCDWKWISDENDNVLKQVESKPVYSATLVKYGNYICHKPHKQIKVTIGENNVKD